MGRLIFMCILAIPLSVGMGIVIAEMFPMMHPNIAGLTGGATTLPTLALLTFWAD